MTMLSTYRMGIVTPRNGITAVQQTELREHVEFVAKCVGELVLVVPGFRLLTPRASVDGQVRDVADWVVSEGGHADYLPADKDLPAERLARLLAPLCDEIVGLPARGRRPSNPDRVWMLRAHFPRMRIIEHHR